MQHNFKSFIFTNLIMLTHQMVLQSKNCFENRANAKFGIA